MVGEYAGRGHLLLTKDAQTLKEEENLILEKAVFALFFQERTKIKSATQRRILKKAPLHAFI